MVHLLSRCLDHPPDLTSLAATAWRWLLLIVSTCCCIDRFFEVLWICDWVQIICIEIHLSSIVFVRCNLPQQVLSSSNRIRGSVPRYTALSSCRITCDLNCFLDDALLRSLTIGLIRICIDEFFAVEVVGISPVLRPLSSLLLFILYFDILLSHLTVVILTLFFPFLLLSTH